MPYSRALPANEHDVWRLHLDLLDAATPIIESLLKHSDEDGRRYLLALSKVDLGKVAAIKTIFGEGVSPSGRGRSVGTFA